MTETEVQTKAVSYGGFWKRLVAYILDWIILTIIGVIVLVGAGMLMASKGLDPESEDAMLRVGLASDMVTLFIAWLYYAGMESSGKQATLGKLALGMKVTDIKGERISFLRATVRQFSKILSFLLFLIGFIMIAFTEKKQGLHDMIAGTLIVNK